MESPERERAKLTPPSNIINRGSSHFMGREDELQKLDENLQRVDCLLICAVSGMGGIGKTELVLQYALRYQAKYPGGLCWLNKGDIGSQIIYYYRNSLGLNIPENSDITTQLNYCWREWQAGNVLLILDDVTDYGAIKDYLPPAQPKFKILITSRQYLGSNIKTISLDVLTEDAALNLLRSLTTEQRISNQIAIAKRLVKWLGYLPLGLELVGRYLQRHPTINLEELLEKLETNKLAAKALSKSQKDYDIAHAGIAAAFELSWIELTKEAQELAAVLSLFAVEPFPWSLVEECLAESDREKLRELRDDELFAAHLLQITEENTWQLHPLIREFLQTKLESLPEADNYKRSFCQVIVEQAKLIPETPTLQEINDCTFLIPHLTETTDNLIDWVADDSLIHCYFGLSKFHSGQGIYSSAANWSDKGLEIIKNRLGENHPDVATSLNNLAFLYDSQGKYDQAEPLYLQALEIAIKSLGKEHPNTITIANNLAYLQSVSQQRQKKSLWQRLTQITPRFW